jgi:hypothetical protein
MENFEELSPSIKQVVLQFGVWMITKTGLHFAVDVLYIDDITDNTLHMNLSLVTASVTDVTDTAVRRGSRMFPCISPNIHRIYCCLDKTFRP